MSSDTFITDSCSARTESDAWCLASERIRASCSLHTARKASRLSGTRLRFRLASAPPSPPSSAAPASAASAASAAPVISCFCL